MTALRSRRPPCRVIPTSGRRWRGGCAVLGARQRGSPPATGSPWRDPGAWKPGVALGLSGVGKPTRVWVTRRLSSPGAGEGALISDEEFLGLSRLLTYDLLGCLRRGVGVEPAQDVWAGAPAQARHRHHVLPAGLHPAAVADLRDTGVHRVDEPVPRISRAQSMDALSQALVAGYRCAIVAAGMLRRFFPQNMTAAGTIQPARIVALGAGVAGLQAIATARRLGAVVSAYDVRAAAAEEIRSMGRQGVDLELETLEGAVATPAR